MTEERSAAVIAPLSVGLALTPIHLDPDDDTSINPARSTGPALFVGGWAMSQLWLFAHTKADRSPGPINDTPVELSMGADRTPAEDGRA